MARVARKAPQIESRSLARISQGPHGREIAAVRGLRSRSALLRLDRQPGEATRRRSLCDQGDAAQSHQQMVRHQSSALDGAERRGVADASRPGRGAYREQIRAQAKHSRAAELHQNGNQVESCRVDLFSEAAAKGASQLRRLDPYRQAT